MVSEHNIAENNRRIAKNTLFLYIRMLFSVLVSLYTSRVVLNTLGIDDYGVYNVVGGVVSMMGVITSLLSQGTTRFITIAVGKGDDNLLRTTCSALLTIHLIFGLLIFGLGEFIGTWIINDYLNIDPNRLDAARTVFHFSLISSVIGIIQTPYMSTIIAYERMDVFAYVSIWDVLAKLGIVYLLVVIDYDKLKLYSVLFFCVTTISALLYRTYCTKHFEESKFKFRFDASLYKEIINYTGWNAVGSIAFTANGQGITILLNVFFGTVVNAARGIAGSVANIVSQFIGNFQQAITPQVVKYYAVNDLKSMNSLTLNASKYSAYLVLLFAVPLFLETPFVLKLWLGIVPEYTVIFTRLTLIQIFIQAIDIPVGNAIHAVGKMKLPNLTAAIVYLTILPLSYFCMKYYNASPEITYIIIVLVYPVALFVDLWILNKYTQFSTKDFIKEAFIVPVIFFIISAIIPISIMKLMDESFIRLFIIAIIYASVLAMVVLFWVLERDERRKLQVFLSNKFSRE